MIILLVVVFDPLAIALLIAAQSGMHIEATRRRPNAATIAAMEEPTEELKRFKTVEELFEDLNSEETLDTKEVIELQEVKEPEIQEIPDQASWLDNVKNARRGAVITDPPTVTFNVER
jgi:hypothetical protein